MGDSICLIANMRHCSRALPFLKTHRFNMITQMLQAKKWMLAQNG